MVEVGEDERALGVDRLHDSPQTRDIFIRVGAELTRVLPAHRVDEEGLKDDEAGAALRAAPVVRDVAVRRHAIGAAECGLDRRQGEAVGQLNRSDAESFEYPRVHTASRGMLWTIDWSLCMVST